MRGGFQIRLAGTVVAPGSRPKQTAKGKAKRTQEAIKIFHSPLRNTGQKET